MPNGGNQPQSGRRSGRAPALPPPGRKRQKSLAFTINGLPSHAIRSLMVPSSRHRPPQHAPVPLICLHQFQPLQSSRSRQFFAILVRESRRFRKGSRQASRKDSDGTLGQEETWLEGPAQTPSGRYGCDPQQRQRAKRDRQRKEGGKRENVGGETRTVPTRRVRADSSDSRREPAEEGGRKRKTGGEDGEGQGTIPQRKPRSTGFLRLDADATIRETYSRPSPRLISKKSKTTSGTWTELLDNIESSGGNPHLPGSSGNRYSEMRLDPDRFQRFCRGSRGTTLAITNATRAITNRVTWLQPGNLQRKQFVSSSVAVVGSSQAYETPSSNGFHNFQPNVHQSIIKYDKAVRQLIGSRRDILLDEGSSTPDNSKSNGRPRNKAKKSVSDSTEETATDAREASMLKAVAKRGMGQTITRRSGFLEGSRGLHGMGNEEEIGEGNDESDGGIRLEGPSVKRPNLPRFIEGFGFRDDVTPQGSRTAEYTIHDETTSATSTGRVRRASMVDHSKSNPHLFRVQTPINIDRFETILETHPNKPFVKSVLVGLREGFWPWATTHPRHEVPDYLGLVMGPASIG
ncbi:hypothetical protein BT96DRAFT_987228 [Gymnopus androsaceus JB14]|uniref:Uncharacterized protein n=1 Tax=Gymnopus androsaceus JB14 TaxID=1447944 RepID=A0A6A4I462_9AGAR|nr:hypothetical protein BT96DRAFT_987228 [Gymnopus androsaceus JB14]